MYCNLWFVKTNWKMAVFLRICGQTVNALHIIALSHIIAEIPITALEGYELQTVPNNRSQDDNGTESHPYMQPIRVLNSIITLSICAFGIIGNLINLVILTHRRLFDNGRTYRRGGLLRHGGSGHVWFCLLRCGINKIQHQRRNEHHIQRKWFWSVLHLYPNIFAKLILVRQYVAYGGDNGRTLCGGMSSNTGTLLSYQDCH